MENRTIIVSSSWCLLMAHVYLYSLLDNCLRLGKFCHPLGHPCWFTLRLSTDMFNGMDI